MSKTIGNMTLKATPVGTDAVAIADSEDSDKTKKVLLSSIAGGGSLATLSDVSFTLPLQDAQLLKYDAVNGYWYNGSSSTVTVAWTDISGKPTFATVATSGDYSDLINTPSLATVATTGDYGDLLNTPTIPTVNDATLTIQKNSTNVGTFTANASSNVTIDISVPIDTGDLTNNAGFITSSDIPALPSNTDLSDYDNSVSKFVNDTDLSTKQDVIDANNKLDYAYLSNTPTIPSDIDDLSDVTIDTNTLADGQLLKYDSNSSKWVNGSPSSASVSFQDITGQPTDNTNLANALNAKATGGDNLTTTGVTNVGLYSTTTSGVLKFKSLVAGTNISLTPNVDGNSVEVASSISNADASHTGLLTSSDWQTFAYDRVPVQYINTDSVSTSVTIANLIENNRYVYTQPLTSLTITAIVDSNLESDIQFSTAAGGCTFTYPGTLKWIGSDVIEPSKNYILSIKNNIAVLGEFA